MSPVFWSNAKSPIQRPGGIFWRAGRFARIQAAAKAATASFGSHTSFPAIISAADKKAVANFSGVMLPRGTISATAPKQSAAISGVMEPRGIISVQMGKAIAKLMQKDLSTIAASGRKASTIMSAKEIEQASLNVLIKKATALISVTEHERGTIGAVGKKSVAAFAAHAPAPPIFDSTNGWGGQNTSDYTHTIDAAANCIVGIVGLTSTDTSIAQGDVTITVGGTNIPLLPSGSLLSWHTFQTTSSFVITNNWQSCLWVFGLIGTIPTGAQTVHIVQNTSGGSNTFFNIQTWSFKNAISFDPVQHTADQNVTAVTQSVSALGASIVVQGFFDSDAVSSGNFTGYNQTQDNIHGAATFSAASIFGHASGPNPVFNATTPSGWNSMGIAVPVNGS